MSSSPEQQEPPKSTTAAAGVVDVDDVDTTTTATAATATAGTDSTTISREELTALVRAVAFAMGGPEASQRGVYREITQEIPKKFPQFAFLGESAVVEFSDIRKVWKKATTAQQQQQKQQTSSSSSSAAAPSENADLLAKFKELHVGTTPQLMTIGDVTTQGSMAVQQAATSVARQYMMALLQEQDAEQAAFQKEREAELQDYVHVFLNVPADTSGTRPNQAVMSFQQSSNNNKKAAVDKSSGGKKGKGKKKQNTSGAAAAPTTTTALSVPDAPPFEDATIVKIQMAAPLNEIDSVKHPMLLYDQSRKLQTFIHYQPPPPPTPEDAAGSATTAATASDDIDDNDDVGYLKVARWIDAAGKSGALGNQGGTKAYFYARLTTTKVKKSKGSGKGGSPSNNDILSIYIKELAPPQAW
ncbi:MAG: hypothetical protein SGILL_008685 [Bacillariaceae sp.]